LRKYLDDNRGNDLEKLTHTFINAADMQVVLVGDPQIIQSQVGQSLGELKTLDPTWD